jgi:manganese/zinc/iron transport system permease protein
MNWTSTDTWIVVVGMLCAVACALPGCFLVLRKMSMMGDAISHAVLPGVAIAFIITGTKASVPMFIGAAAAGVLTAVFTQWISKLGNVDRGAAMGIVFTTLFAI